VILSEILGNEAHPVYQELEIANGSRQYDFLRSLVTTSLAVQRPFLSSHIIKALNFHAITCLHPNAGEFRPCPVVVGPNDPKPYHPPAPYRVQALMDDFVNTVNRAWEKTEPVSLAAFVLWRLNWIHPFINGNGRSARAASYFVLCVKANLWLPGAPILPELLRTERARYVAALKAGDDSAETGNLDLSELHGLMTELLQQQVNPTPPAAAAATGAGPPLLPAP
jgi:Fic family protein